MGRHAKKTKFVSITTDSKEAFLNYEANAKYRHPFVKCSECETKLRPKQFIEHYGKMVPNHLHQRAQGFLLERNRPWMIDSHK